MCFEKTQITLAAVQGISECLGFQDAGYDRETLGDSEVIDGHIPHISHIFDSVK